MLPVHAPPVGIQWPVKVTILGGDECANYGKNIREVRRVKTKDDHQ